MGEVYLARDLKLGRKVALKLLQPGIFDAERAERFLFEAQVLARFNHPNIVTVFDQGKDGDFTFMVMEFVEGQTLERVIEKGGPMPIEQGLAVAEEPFAEADRCAQWILDTWLAD